MPSSLYINNQFKNLQWGGAMKERGSRVGGIADTWYRADVYNYVDYGSNYNSMWGITPNSEAYIAPFGGKGIYYVSASFSASVAFPTPPTFELIYRLAMDINGTTEYSSPMYVSAYVSLIPFPLSISTIFRINDSDDGDPNDPLKSPQFYLEMNNFTSTKEINTSHLCLNVIRLY